MKRLALTIVSWAVLAVLVWPVSGGSRRGPERAAGLCDELTPARILEDPAVADAWARALRSAAPGDAARARALLDGIRAAHGCAAPEPDADLPPGHPPGGDDPAPGLPFAHPPIPSAPWTPIFADPALVTI